MSMRTPVIAGNWKMHMGPIAAREFFERYLELQAPRDDATIIFFPPSISLASAREAAGNRPDVRFGVQNIHWEPKGAFTGEISATMAAEAGAGLALIGHSERRHVFGERSEEVARKLRAALDAGLGAMVCVGETIDERRSGRAESVVFEQLAPVLDEISASELSRLSLAYEPVWAIGTGETATPADASAMHQAIRRTLAEAFGAAAADAIPLLYGGSVKPENAAELLGAPGVDGLLVGGASLDPEAFAAICAASA